MFRMASPSNLFLLLATVTFTNLEYAKSDDVYDCYAYQERLLKRYGRTASVYWWFPRCMAGGYYENVQCDFNGCFCAYLDSGKRVPQTDENVYMEYMREHCPWLSEKEPDPCMTPPRDYPCKTKSLRFFYNSDTGDCVESVSGCLGFDSSEACKQSCVVQKKDRCNFKLTKGRTCDRRERSERWYHDEKKGECRPFLHEGCGGNSNNYREKWICLKTCAPTHNTELVIQVGKMKYIISLPTWLVTEKLYVASATNNLSVEEFKDIESEMVEIARFPAPEGEDEDEPRKLPEIERFRPKHAPKNMTRKEICEKGKDTGPCRGLFPRWYFDVKQSRCVKFTYGGCLGNENRHTTATGCATYCNAEIKPTEAERIEDLIASGGTIGGISDDRKPHGGGGKPRVLDVGPPTIKPEDKEGVVGGEAEIEFVFGDDDDPQDSGDNADAKDTSAPSE